MLDRMPVADEETVRNRRARFRNDDVRTHGLVEQEGDGKGGTRSETCTRYMNTAVE